MTKLHSLFVKCVFVALFAICSVNQAFASEKVVSERDKVNDKQELEMDIKAYAARLDFYIEPNPTSTKEIKVSILGANMSHVLEVTVYNTIGNVVYKTLIQGASQNITFVITPEEEFKKGLYFLALKNGQERVTKKFVIK